jgi:hypothetical protein
MPTQIQRTKNGKRKGNIMNFDATKQKISQVISSNL